MLDKEEYDELRQTLLKYYHGDVVRTTRYLDVFEEWLVLNKYLYWIDGEIRAAVTKDEQKNLEFFDNLLKEVLLDEDGLWNEYKGAGVKLVIRGDLWTVEGRKHWTILNSLAVNLSTSPSTKLPANNASTTACLNTRAIQATSAIADLATEYIHLNNSSGSPLPTAMTRLHLKTNTAGGDDRNTSLSAVFCGCHCG